jgi:hypothetical protein
MVEVGGPEVLVAENMSLAIAAAIGYCGAPMLDRLGGYVKRAMALRAGFRPHCGQPLEEDGPLCPHCQRQGGEEGNGELSSRIKKLEEYGDVERNSFRSRAPNGIHSVHGHRTEFIPFYVLLAGWVSQPCARV